MGLWMGSEADDGPVAMSLEEEGGGQECHKRLLKPLNLPLQFL
jgi:hypothetical protein